MPWGSYDERRVRGINPHLATGYGSFENVYAKADALMGLRFADAEQAKSTGGMVALVPRADDAHKLAVPGGEPVEDLHVTLAYLGEDVSDQDPSHLGPAISHIASSFSVITARIMGHAQFNPDGGEDGTKDPCATYLVSDSEQLDDLHKAVLDACTQAVNLPQQHKPWVAHLTAGYGVPPGSLKFTGAVLFDRLQFAFAGDDHYFPLLGSTTPETHS